MSEPHLVNVLFWTVTYVASWLAFVGFFVADIVSRWGDVLVLEWQTLTLIWVAALILSKIAAIVVKVNAKRMGVTV